MNENHLPEIGPHEGRELELMLAGTKPVAMFSELVPEAAFAPHVRAGQIVRREAMPHVYFALPGEEWRIDLLDAIHREIYTGERRATDGDEETIGRLLGYTAHEIAVFISHLRARRGA